MSRFELRERLYPNERDRVHDLSSSCVLAVLSCLIKEASERSFERNKTIIPAVTPTNVEIYSNLLDSDAEKIEITMLSAFPDAKLTSITGMCTEATCDSLANHFVLGTSSRSVDACRYSSIGSIWRTFPLARLSHPTRCSAVCRSTELDDVRYSSVERRMPMFPLWSNRRVSAASASTSATTNATAVAASSATISVSGHVANSASVQQCNLQPLDHESDIRQRAVQLNSQRMQRCERQEPWLLSVVKTDAFLHLASGAVAGAASRTITAPLDRIKVLMQLGGGASGLSVWQAMVQVLDHENGKRVNARSMDFQEFVRASIKGWRGFFRGNLTNCCKVVPETALKLYAYDFIKQALVRYKGLSNVDIENDLSKDRCRGVCAYPTTDSTSTDSYSRVLSFREKLLCGALAGITAQFTMYPMELVKTRLVAFSPGCKYNGVIQCMLEIWREGGVRRMYRGLGPSLLGIIPYAGIDLACFETLKNMYVRQILEPRARRTADATQSDVGLLTPSIGALLVIGAFSSLIGQVVAYPTALVRTRVQVDGSQGRKLRYRSSFHAALHAVQDGGWRGLYRGLGANLLKSVPAVSVSWIVYEKSKDGINAGVCAWQKRLDDM